MTLSWSLSEDVIELLIYHQPSVKPSLTLRPFGVLGYVAGHSLTVIVDSVTKQAHFILTVTTLSAAGTAQLFLQHVWKHHGLPQKVISDQGPQFEVEFTQ